MPPKGFLLVNLVEHTADATEDLGDSAEALDAYVLVHQLVVIVDGASLIVVHNETLLDGLKVVVSTSGSFATLNKTADDFVFGNVDIDEDGGLVAALLHETLELHSLVEGTWEAVENEALGVSRKRVDMLLEELDGHVVRNELSLARERGNKLSEFATRSHFLAHQIAGGEVGKTVFIYDEIRLCTFAAARCTTEDNINHKSM